MLCGSVLDMRNICNIILSVCALILCVCCGRTQDTHGPSVDAVDALGDRLDRLTVNGEWDSLFSITMPLVYGAQTDTVSKVCASLYNAQYWLYRESLDSVAHYLDIVQRNLDSIDGLGMEGMYYVLEGMYRMKSEWDFPGMVELLLKSYDVYKELGEVSNMAYPLINIVNFYYMRSDVRGLDYAREVYALVRDNSLSPYYQGVASMIMAEMLSLSDSPGDAWPYLRTADSLIRSEEYEPYYSIIDLLKADMSLLDRDSTAADSLYAVALEREAVTEPVVISLICLHYGRFCEDRGMNGKAAELYRKGLAISDRYANMELRNELQLHLADVSYELGDMKGSLSNYRASHLGQVRSQEWELNDLRMSYQEVLHKQEVQAKELDLVKSRRLILVVVFVGPVPELHAADAAETAGRRGGPPSLGKGGADDECGQTVSPEGPDAGKHGAGAGDQPDLSLKGCECVFRRQFQQLCGPSPYSPYPRGGWHHRGQRRCRGFEGTRSGSRIQFRYGFLQGLLQGDRTVSGQV